MSKGGLFVGEHHNKNGNAENGIKVSVPEGQIEVESQEVIITKPAVLSKKKYLFQGQMLTNCEILDKINRSGGGVGIPCNHVKSAHKKGERGELVGLMAKGGKIEDKDKKEIYRKWSNLVNMSKSELKRFYDSKEGKEAGLKKSVADSMGIKSGRESAMWIMKMKDLHNSKWTPEMWRWATRQISFISRMSGNKGSLYDENGNKTRKHLSLLIWGHNPIK